MEYPKRSQYKYAKTRYRIGNWPEYEAGLRQRGDLTVWLSEDAINSWREPPSGKPGGQRTYADIDRARPVSACPTATEWPDPSSRDGASVLISEPCTSADARSTCHPTTRLTCDGPTG